MLTVVTLLLVVKSCDPLTAWFEVAERSPDLTSFISLFPAEIPVVVILGPLTITKPVASKVVPPPIFALLSVTSLAKSNFTLLSLSPFVILRFLLSAEKSTPLFIGTVVLFALSTDNFQPFFLTTSSKSFNCAIFTASVSSVPAATPVIWRVIFLASSPTLTIPCVLFHCALVFVVGPFRLGAYPKTPASLLAIESLPSAILSLVFALESAPIAILPPPFACE